MIDKVNTLLGEGLTVAEIRKQLDISEKKFQKYMKDNKYKFNQKLKRYDKKPTNDIADKEHTKVIYDINEPTNSIPTNIKEDLIEIIQMKEDLIEVVRAFKEGYAKEPTQVIEIIDDKGIKISLPKGEVVRTTVRANKPVLDMWNEFCGLHNEFSKQDLISMAMLEYIDKYKKK